MGASSMLGVTMEESGISKIIALRLDEDIENIKNDFEDKTEDFVEEDVPPEEGVVLPPRPPRRTKEAQAEAANENEAERGES